MDLTKVRALIKMLDGTDVSEIEITEADGAGKVRISRQNNHHVGSNHAAAPIVYHTPASATATPNSVETTTPPSKEQKEETIKGHALKSPMVGTAYLASSPDAEPFARVGQRVVAGEIICIIEAMKMCNQIEADVSGIISGRLIENGQPVEYGQTLFIIETE